MIPLLATATQGDTMKKVGLAVGAGAVIITGYFVYKSWNKKNNIKTTASKYGDGSKEGQAVELAGLMYSALHSGWFNMTEDEEAIYTTAAKMHESGISMKLVGDAYRKLYNTELVTELNRLLSPDELVIMNNALNGKYKKL